MIFGKMPTFSDESKPEEVKDAVEALSESPKELVAVHESPNSVAVSKEVTDFIPEDLLKTLACKPSHGSQSDLPASSRPRPLEVSVSKSRKPPAPAWHHKNCRHRLKHLTENISCSCGAGRDVSFLYDLAQPDKLPEIINKKDPSHARKQYENETLPKKVKRSDPLSLIPEEYHIVKSEGVKGLEYHEDQYTTIPEDHDKHMVIFPSLNPTSRSEVIQLKNTFEDLLQKLGFHDEELEMKGPTQMHNLLELIKKEQNMYNVVFQELIRQVTVHCHERGELLSEVRNRYATLLARIPRQVKSLHDEVIAQRALDRRLMEELIAFRENIVELTDELSEVQEHDHIVTVKAEETEKNLEQALTEAQRNANLLSEYHELYELQRRRLEKAVSFLSDEKELWSRAAYSLSLKVIKENNMNTARRLQLHEKAWCKLAGHFSVALADADMQDITILSGNMEKWRQIVEKLSSDLNAQDVESKMRLARVKESLLAMHRRFIDKLSKEGDPGGAGRLKTLPDIEEIKDIFETLKDWEKEITSECENFSGEIMLLREERVITMRTLIADWTDLADGIFDRHKPDSGQPTQEQIEMKALNEQMPRMMWDIDDLIGQFQVRMTGENGAADQLLYLVNTWESWHTKFNTSISTSSSGTIPLPESEWIRFVSLIEDWAQCAQVALDSIGSTQNQKTANPNVKHIDLEPLEVIKKASSWLSSLTNGMDSEDNRIIEQVTSMHHEMIQWMVGVLLHLAPDPENLTAEAKDMMMFSAPSVGDLREHAFKLFTKLQAFSITILECLRDLVKKGLPNQSKKDQVNSDQDYVMLIQLQNEACDWIETAQLLLEELSGEPIRFQVMTRLGTAKSEELNKRKVATLAQTTAHEQEVLLMGKTFDRLDSSKRKHGRGAADKQMGPESRHSIQPKPTINEIWSIWLASDSTQKLYEIWSIFTQVSREVTLLSIAESEETEDAEESTSTETNTKDTTSTIGKVESDEPTVKGDTDKTEEISKTVTRETTMTSDKSDEEIKRIQDDTSKPPEIVHYIGADSNIHTKELHQSPHEKPIVAPTEELKRQGIDPAMKRSQILHRDIIKEGEQTAVGKSSENETSRPTSSSRSQREFTSPDPDVSYEALGTIKELQKNIMELEDGRLEAENRAQQAETQLLEAQKTIRQLQRELELTKEETKKDSTIIDRKNSAKKTDKKSGEKAAIKGPQQKSSEKAEQDGSVHSRASSRKSTSSSKSKKHK